MQLKLISGWFSLLVHQTKKKGNETERETKANIFLISISSIANTQLKSEFQEEKYHVFFYINGIIAVVLDCEDEYAGDLALKRIESVKGKSIVTTDTRFALVLAKEEEMERIARKREGEQSEMVYKDECCERTMKTHQRITQSADRLTKNSNIFWVLYLTTN